MLGALFTHRLCGKTKSGKKLKEILMEKVYHKEASIAITKGTNKLGFSFRVDPV